MKLKPSLYEELIRYAGNPGVLILIDCDALSTPSIQGGRCVYDSQKNQLTIYGNGLTPVEEADLIKFLKEIQDEGIEILDSEQEEMISEYEGYSDTYNPYKDAIELFSHKIPKKDLWALKMAFYMRIKNENGEDIKQYRWQIKERFGMRGLYISNLCNSGYYEGPFKSALLKLDTSKFKEYYELRVGFELAALFVHNGITSKTLPKIIAEKIELCSKNGVFKFKIHAMGRDNVDLVRKLISSPPDFGMDIVIRVISEADSHPVFIDVEIEIN